MADESDHRCVTLPFMLQGLNVTSHVAYKVARDVGAKLIIITGPDKTVSHHGKLYASRLVVRGGVRKTEIADYLGRRRAHVSERSLATSGIFHYLC
jgi:hypothetical protein